MADLNYVRCLMATTCSGTCLLAKKLRVICPLPYIIGGSTFACFHCIGVHSKKASCHTTISAMLIEMLIAGLMAVRKQYLLHSLIV